MSTLLLHTKLCAPSIRRREVLRPHLDARLEELLEPEIRLGLIAAPPGFGKTTLIGGWLARRNLPAAWLTLDGADDELVRFWDYVIAALGGQIPGVGAESLTLLHEPTRLPLETILLPLLNELAEWSERGQTPSAPPVVLVLDDYHHIQMEAIHRALTFFLEQLPTRLRVILTSRADPPLPLARFRVRNQLVEIRAADLRFRAPEAGEFIRDMTGLELDAATLDGLATRTEGWAAGLQVAGLALRGQPDPAAFLQTFTGDHRYLLDYLDDEVLARQTPSLQSFLLSTSILGRLNASLCATITQQDQAQDYLDYLERNHLFVVALDQNRQWYRYHQLFGDFLRYRLQQTAPDQIPLLHQRAAAWCEGHGLLAESVSHALAAQDYELAMRLIEQAAEHLLWRRPELHTLLEWLNALPADSLRQRPRLCLYHAWTFYLTNQMERAGQRVQEASAALAQDPDRDPTTAGMLAAIRSTLTGIRRQFPASLAQARQALTLLPQGVISWRCIAAINLGVSAAAIGDAQEANTQLGFALEVSQEIGSAFAMLSAFWHMAALQLTQLQLRQAEAVCRQLLHLIRDPDLQRFPVDGYIALLLGEIALERNELEDATHYLLESAETINPEGFPLALLRSFVALAQVYRIRHDADGERKYLDRAEQLIAQHGLQGRAAPYEIDWARCRLAEGNLAAVGQWVQAQGLDAADDFHPYQDPHYLLLARYLLAAAKPQAPSSDLAPVLSLLGRMAEQAERTGRAGSRIRVGVVQALLYARLEQSAAAQEVLAQALALAEPEGCIRTLLGDSPTERETLAALLAALLRRVPPSATANGRAPSPAYMAHILAVLESSSQSAYSTPEITTSSAATASLHQFLVEPLSERELEVLRLLHEGLSSNEVAARLVIAVGTARKHMKNIYGKLDAHSRLEAIRRGQQLGLL